MTPGFFYLDWTVDEPSDSAEVATYPVGSLSEQDQLILDTAVTDLPEPGRRAGPPDDYDWAVEYHAELDPSTSELVPDPPFDYVRTERETFGAVAEQAPIQKTERTISAEAVGETESEYMEYAREEFPDVDFSEVELSNDARSIVEQVTDGSSAYSYEEEPPLSGGLESVLEYLGAAEYLQPHDEYEEFTVFLQDGLASFQGRWFAVNLLIYP